MSFVRSLPFKLLLGTVAAAVLGIIAWRHFRGPSPAAIAPQYTVAPVTRGEIAKAVLTTGQLSPLVTVEVSSQISGLLTSVRVDFNSPVKKGDILAELDPSTYRQRLKQAEADLAATEASHHLSVLDSDRLKDLRGRDLVTQQDYDRAFADRQRAEASLLTAKAAVENARLELERCTLTAPIDGVVIFKAAEVGKTVAASFSAPTLFVIAQDLSKMQILAKVSEVDVRAVKPGMPVTFTVDAIADRTFTGQLKQLRNPYTPSDKPSSSPSPDNAITTFDAVIAVDNADLALLPSLSAKVSIIAARSQGALCIPNGALRVKIPGVRSPAQGAANPTQSLTTVYRLPGGNRDAAPEPVAITTGLTDGIQTEVLSGLSEGDVVITGATKPQPKGRLIGF